MVTTGNTHVSRTKHCIKKFYCLISNIKNTVENMMHSCVLKQCLEYLIYSVHVSSQLKWKLRREQRNNVIISNYLDAIVIKYPNILWFVYTCWKVLSTTALWYKQVLHVNTATPAWHLTKSCYGHLDEDE